MRAVLKSVVRLDVFVADLSFDPYVQVTRPLIDEYLLRAGRSDCFVRIIVRNSMLIPSAFLTEISDGRVASKSLFESLKSISYRGGFS